MRMLEIITAFGILFCCPSAVLADWTVGYSTDFSIDPHWETNRPDLFYWDAVSKEYYCEMNNGSLHYATVNIDSIYSAGSPFRIEYDARILQNEWSSGFNFGLWNNAREMWDPNTVELEFTNPDPGRGFTLRTHDCDGICHVQNRFVGFDLGVWYHVAIEYDGSWVLTSEVKREESVVAVHVLTGVEYCFDGYNLGAARHHEYVGATTIAKIDNVTFYVGEEEQGIVDDSDPGFHTFTGEWTPHVHAMAHRGNLVVAQGGGGYTMAGWRIDRDISPGMHEVYVWKFEHAYMEDMATNAPYLVCHQNGVSGWIPVDQSAPGSEWVYLGTFEFSNAFAQGVLMNNNADGYVIADAVKFLYVGSLP